MLCNVGILHSLADSGSVRSTPGVLPPNWRRSHVVAAEVHAARKSVRSAACRPRIYPLRVKLDGHTGITLWAPEWRDGSGEQWTGLLGTDDHVYVFETDESLLRWLGTTEKTGLDEHPDWPSMKTWLTPAQLARADDVDLEAMFFLFGRPAAPAGCEDAAHSVQLTRALASACDDVDMVEVLDRTAYTQIAALDSGDGLAPDDATWVRLGTEVAESWGWVLERAATHIAFVGTDGPDTRLPKAPASPWRTSSAPPPEVAVLAPLPSRAATILVTALFGVFGAIPAAVASAEARRLQQPTGRYWETFGIVLLIQFVLVFGVIGIAITAS